MGTRPIFISFATLESAQSFLRRARGAGVEATLLLEGDRNVMVSVAGDAEGLRLLLSDLGGGRRVQTEEG